MSYKERAKYADFQRSVENYVKIAKMAINRELQKDHHLCDTFWLSVVFISCYVTSAN